MGAPRIADMTKILPFYRFTTERLQNQQSSPVGASL
jgi:hypothetical protein